jgi:hypothetical protein
MSGQPGNAKFISSGKDGSNFQESDMLRNQEAMKFSKLMSLPELHDHYKEYSEKTFADDSGVLEDAFIHGPFHEEKFRFNLLATRLSDSELVSLFLPLAHALVRGTPSGHIDEIRELYQALDEWQGGKLKDKQRLTDCLARVRSSVLDLSPGWASSAIPFYRVLELGINERLGASPSELWALEKKYNVE